MFTRLPLLSTIFAVILLVSSLLFLSRNTEKLTNLNASAQGAAVSGAGSNLSAQYTFDEGSGFSITDSIGSKNGRLVGGSGWVTNGKVGSGGFFGALSLDGTDDRVDIPYDASQDSNSLTISVWVKLGGTPDDLDTIVSRGYNAGLDRIPYFISINSGKFSFGTYASGSSNTPIWSTTPTVGQWYHLVGTYDGSSYKLYVNGNLVDTVNATISLQTSDKGVNIGYLDVNGSPGRFINATIDDVRIYSRPLNSTEVVELYNTKDSGVTRPTPGSSDTQDPVVSVSAPSTGTYSGSITVSGTASDNVGIAGVTFKADGNTIGTEDTSSPYSVSLDTSTLSNGSHTITAVARDTSNNTAVSSGRNITVSNTGPDITPPTVTSSMSSSYTSGTTQVTLQVSTNENATCRYSPVALPVSANNAAAVLVFNALSHQLNGGGSTSHSSSAPIPVSAGSAYTYYIRCQDTAAALNTNTADKVVTFSVRSVSVTPTNAEIIGNEALQEFPTSALWNRQVNFKPGNYEVDHIKVKINPPLFSWPYEPNPDAWIEYGASKKFWLQVDNDIDFSSPIVNEPTEDNMYSFLGPDLFTPGVKYYWRVAYLYRNASTPYVFSARRSFIIDSNATEWDRSKLADDTYLMSKAAHPHVLFNSGNRRALYQYLNGKAQDYISGALSNDPFNAEVGRG